MIHARTLLVNNLWLFSAVLLLASCASTLTAPLEARKEFAPMGRLRAAINYGNPVLATKDSTTGELRGVSVELSRELGRRLHVPVELIGYETIAKLAKQSPGEFLWNGAFLQLSNSKVESYFADRRTYVHDGKPVDQQDHVGFDLSVVQHAPIEAANDGKVVVADYFGIYGNAVLIGHGAGLISLYGHMSSIDVKPGQMVKKKEILGKSGATGLAAGDHLHFGLFLHGVPVNPTEWWDEKWIRDHVLDRLTQP